MEKSTSQGPKRSLSSGSTLVGNSTDDQSFSSSIEDYDINLENPIGYGASARVYSAIYKPSGKKVAVKMINLDFFERNQIDEVRRETQLMSLSKHPNVLRVYGSFVNESNLYIVTPYMSAGSCSDIMKTAYPDGFEEAAIATILKQALQGLDYLHKTGHIHRDVKAGNLLVDEDGTVSLADFGVSSSLTENGDRRGFRRTFVGTPCWMAPEVMKHADYDYKADIWSFGITSIELATGNAPFAKYSPIKVIMVTLSNDPPTLDRDSTKHKYSKAFKEMIDQSLQKDPSKRLSAEKLLNHQFFRLAKRKDYLVTKILQNLPALEKRPHKRVQQKPITYTKGEDTWDFHETDEILLSSQEMKHVSFNMISDAGELPTSEEDSSTATNVLPKKSRFLIVDQDTSPELVTQLPSSVPTTPSDTSFTQFPPHSPSSSGFQQQLSIEEQSQAIKKGRFSVTERTVSNDSQLEHESQRPPLEREQSNENITDKKSRFEVQQKTIPPSSVPAAAATTIVNNDSNEDGGSTDIMTTEKPTSDEKSTTSTKKGRFQVQTKANSSTSSSGNISEVTCSPQSTITGHSPSVSPTSSILRGQMNTNTVTIQINTLLRQNELQRSVLSDLLGLCGDTTSLDARLLSQPLQYQNPQPFQNGNSEFHISSSKEMSDYLNNIDRQFQHILRENEDLRKENENLRREVDRLRKLQPVSTTNNAPDLI
ncbi:11219_t:CDS:10 [Dentiscutata erythropus]|uniref:11219_t:CDS:1 n=1 Tax=Dentiscutata erythropus TaxID=1348616 RepID=A0A9N9CBT0_9GLOM|nr:11219_t:CDS:10 [Dentiscutata erythropus]